MSSWQNLELIKVINFNPSEKLPKGIIAKKIPMANLEVSARKITGFEYEVYNSGPKFRNGDTLVAKITPCFENGKTAQVDILDENEVAFGSSEFIVLRETERSTNGFVYYLAKSPAFRKKAISCMEGTSGRKRVNEGALKHQILPIPNKAIQTKIASVLSSLDSKIELNHRINSELEAMAKIIYDYWFVQFDFPDANGKPYKSSGGKMVYSKELKREIPEGWEPGNFNDLGEIVGGSTPSRSSDSFFTSSGIPWITPYDLSKNKGNKFIGRGDVDITEAGFKSASLKLLPKDSILLSSRAPIGYIAISRNNVTTNQGFKSFIPNKNYSSSFVYFTIKNSLGLIEKNASGSTFKEISGSVLKSLPVLLPNTGLVKTFNNRVKSIFDRQNLLEIESQQLAELRDWLLPMLMNGQVTVKDAEKEVEMSMAAEPKPTYNGK